MGEEARREAQKKGTQMAEINHSARDHHPDFPPSGLPALSKCPCYKSKPAGAAAERGTQLHEMLEEILTNNELTEELLQMNPKELEIKKR